MAKAILIEPDHEAKCFTAREVQLEVTKDGLPVLQQVYSLLDCDIVEFKEIESMPGRNNALAGHCYYLDDEGLLKDPPPGYLYCPALAPTPLAGRLLICRYDEEEEHLQDVTCMADKVASLVKSCYCNRLFARKAMEQYEAALRRGHPGMICMGGSDLIPLDGD